LSPQIGGRATSLTTAHLAQARQVSLHPQSLNSVIEEVLQLAQADLIGRGVSWSANWLRITQGRR